jgi:hypothetical protein
MHTGRRSGSRRYEIELHKHRYAAWAASRGASVIGCRFSVECGRSLLEACGFTARLCRPDQLPRPGMIDPAHRKWRETMIRSALSNDRVFTHGVAAKLINLYLKCRFVCGGHHGHERVDCLHPPIDGVLLKRLTNLDFGGHGKAWRHAAMKRWSKFDSDDYEQVIGLARESLRGAPLWMIEEHWRGNQ